MSWLEAGVVGFDTETTGVDVDHDRVVSAAVVHRVAAPRTGAVGEADQAGGEAGTPEGTHQGVVTTVRTWLIHPEVEIPPGATEIHGISTEQARRHGRPARVALDELAEVLVAAQRRGEPVVAYNASFDLTLLDVELRRHGLPTVPDRLGRDVAPVLDPFVLDRVLDPYRPGPRRLGDLCERYRVAATAALHRADVDVLATLDVLARMVERFPVLAERTPAELHALQAGEHRAWADVFNAERLARGAPGTAAETHWPARTRQEVRPDVPAPA
ncbi:DNA polymerase III subunit epsilon [Actinotalea ferrariae CF5-4]|uniref:DNA polymerase III subunit epsilon n=1 Tax=Actinotalea ferrariae CF5-4 TaxID=948458 RepID=A0A021W046_9CELL|nr:exonuclease domain-containing protein [Actinotalea ferrariae]EYR64702.1 DNA polymerase III subunit epsilon [Actinotalea ferrariae CF5-4]